MYSTTGKIEDILYFYCRIIVIIMKNKSLRVLLTKNHYHTPPGCALFASLR